MSAAMDLPLDRTSAGPRDVELTDAAPAMTEPEFEAFHRMTVKSLRGYVIRVVGQAAVADDIVQEAYLRFLRSKPVADSIGQMRAFLFRVASRLIVDHWRSHGRERGTPDSREPLAAAGPDVPMRIDLERAFDRLRPEERAMMWLAYVEGADHREIAQALGFQRASIRVVLHRTRRKLARLLRPSSRTDGDK